MADPRYAELVVAACCAASPEGARNAHQHLTADDFTIPAFQAIFQAAIHLPDHPLPTFEQAANYERQRLAGLAPPAVYPSERRLQDLAEAVGATVQELTLLTSQRPVHADTTGRYALQVKAAARQRQERADAVELHQLLNSSTAGDRQRAAALADQLRRQLTNQLQEAQ